MTTKCFMNIKEKRYLHFESNKFIFKESEDSILDEVASTVKKGSKEDDLVSNTY